MSSRPSGRLFVRRSATFVNCLVGCIPIFENTTSSTASSLDIDRSSPASRGLRIGSSASSFFTLNPVHRLDGIAAHILNYSGLIEEPQQGKLVNLQSVKPQTCGPRDLREQVQLRTAASTTLPLNNFFGAAAARAARAAPEVLPPVSPSRYWLLSVVLLFRS